MGLRSEMLPKSSVQKKKKSQPLNVKKKKERKNAKRPVMVESGEICHFTFQLFTFYLSCLVLGHDKKSPVKSLLRSLTLQVSSVLNSTVKKYFDKKHFSMTLSKVSIESLM